MRIYHLNCATQCILGGRLISGQGDFFHVVAMVAHCLLIETESGLVLVDTGLGCDDITAAKRRLSLGFRLLSNPRLEQQETAVFQIEQLEVPTRIDWSRFSIQNRNFLFKCPRWSSLALNLCG